MTWSNRCAESIKREKKEIEARRGIRISQTDIICARCGRPWGYGGHRCQDMRLSELNANQKILPQKTPELCLKLKRIGVKKASTMLYKEENGLVVRDISEETIRAWIKRGNVPEKYQEAVGTL